MGRALFHRLAARELNDAVQYYDLDTASSTPSSPTAGSAVLESGASGGRGLPAMR